MAMNVLFVYPLLRPAKEIYLGYHHGIGYLSALLKQRGHETYLYTAYEVRTEEIAAALKKKKIDAVAITSTSAEFGLAKALAREIVRQGSPPLFVGGIHATLAPEEVMAVEGITGLCRGEGEEGFASMISSLEKGDPATDVPGFWVRDGKGWIKNPPGPPAPLEALPFPDREIFDYSTILKNHSTIIGAEFLGSRGCPYSCTYCSLPVLQGLYAPHRFWRRRPVDHLINEIEQVCSRYTVKMVGFHDDVFTLDRQWLASFCEEYKVRIRRPFWCNTRTGCIHPEAALLLKEAGCVRVHMAVESGSLFIREKVLNRKISDAEIIDSFGFLKGSGIKTLAFNMIGLPFETEETIQQTIALNRKIRPHRIHLTMFRPFPGTDLHTLCKGKGWLKAGADLSYYDEEPTLEQPQISRETLIRYFRRFIHLVYD
jgi:anaerobic magnesium-protoporphyrin IX monomethyl ester cyclase